MCSKMNIHVIWPCLDRDKENTTTTTKFDNNFMSIKRNYLFQIFQRKFLSSDVFIRWICFSSIWMQFDEIEISDHSDEICPSFNRNHPFPPKNSHKFQEISFITATKRLQNSLENQSNLNTDRNSMFTRFFSHLSHDKYGIKLTGPYEIFVFFLYLFAFTVDHLLKLSSIQWAMWLKWGRFLCPTNYVFDCVSNNEVIKS